MSDQEQYFVIVSGDGRSIWKTPYRTYEQATAELNYQIQLAGKNERGWHVETRYHYRKEKKDPFDAL